MEVVLLGTAGWMPSEGRETACVAVRSGSGLILLDAGTGVRRLVTDPSLLAGVASIHVLLSHFHLDHVVGLAYLSAVPQAIPVRVFGPGLWLYGSTTEDIVATLIRPPFQPLRLADLGWDVQDMAPQGVVIDGTPVRLRAQHRHSAPTVAMRLGDALAYITDTAFDPANVEFVASTRVLLHEAFASRDGDATHSSPGEAARVAAGAGCPELHLLHLAPGADEVAVAQKARVVLPSAQVARDLQRWVM